MIAVHKYKKTRLMQRVEREHNRPLEDLIPEMVNESGLSQTAKALDVSMATLNYWILKMGFKPKHILLRPDETVEIKRVVR